MAVNSLVHEVSDLCIGKPALSPLPLSASVADALAALKRCDDQYVSVWTATNPLAKAAGLLAASVCVGKVCLVDVLCFLSSGRHLADPAGALRSPVSALLSPSSPDLVRPVDPESSVLDALDLVLDGAQNLVVPIRSSPAARRKGGQAGAAGFCWLTQEDFVRFFLNSIGLFSPIPALSVEALGIIRTDPLTVRYHDAAISVVPLVKEAALFQTAVAVVTDDGKLIGEISPSTLALFGRGGDAAVAAAVAALSAGELMTYIDCGGLPENAMMLVKDRLREKGLKGMLDLMEEEEEEEWSMFSSSSSSGTSSSDEDSPSPSPPPPPKKAAAARKRSGRRYCRSGSYSARMGRKSEEAIVCHPRSSLVAVMIQALAHRVSYVWVVEEDYELAGVVTFPDVLAVFREQLVL